MARRDREPGPVRGGFDMSLPNPVASRSWAPPGSALARQSAPRNAVGAASVATLLFDGREEAETAVDKAAVKLKPTEGQRKLSEIARKVAGREIRRAIVELLDIKV